MLRILVEKNSKFAYDDHQTIHFRTCSNIFTINFNESNLRSEVKNVYDLTLPSLLNNNLEYLNVSDVITGCVFVKHAAGSNELHVHIN